MQIYKINFKLQKKEKPHLYTKGGEKQYKDYEKNFPCLIISLLLP